MELPIVFWLLDPGEIALSLRHAGTPLSTNDIWIAAAARAEATVIRVQLTH